MLLVARRKVTMALRKSMAVVDIGLMVWVIVLVDLFDCKTRSRGLPSTQTTVPATACPEAGSTVPWEVDRPVAGGG